MHPSPGLCPGCSEPLSCQLCTHQASVGERRDGRGGRGQKRQPGSSTCCSWAGNIASHTPHQPDWEGARLPLQLLAGVKYTRLSPDHSLGKRVPSGGSQAGQLCQQLPSLKERNQLLDQVERDSLKESLTSLKVQGGVTRRHHRKISKLLSYVPGDQETLKFPGQVLMKIGSSKNPR